MSRSPIKRLVAGAACLATAAATAVAIAPAAAANPAGTNVVISEVYGGGGNSGATFTNDFIELYNPTDAAIDVSGWHVAYYSAGSGNTGGNTALSGSIASHGYYLVQEAQGSGGTQSLPTPDAADTVNMSGSHGVVVLWSAAETSIPSPIQQGDLSGVTNIIDAVGYGGSSTRAYETAPAPGLGNATSDSRTDGVDTDDNAADFTEGAPTPQNSGNGGGTTTVTVTDPGGQDATVGTAIDPLTLKVSGGTAPYTWTATGLPAGLTISTDGIISGTPQNAGQYDVTVTATDANDVSGSATFTYYIHAKPVTLTIAQIQGTNTDTSPYAGQTVITTGVVTADYRTGGFNGFYLQTGGSGGTPSQDDTPGASDAVFVYGYNAAHDVTIGDSVRVKGEVSEFHGTTEISYVTVTTLDDALPTVTPAQIPWSKMNSGTEKEAHEGELIAPQGNFTVSGNYNVNYYGTFVLAAGTAPLQQPTDVGTPGSAAALAAVADNAKRKISLDDGSSWNYAVFGSHTSDPLPWLTPSTPARVGSAVTFHQPVVLRYGHDAWKFEPRQQVTGNGSAVATFSNTRAENQHPAQVGGDIRLATFNVENYFRITGKEYVANGGTCTFYKDREGNPIGDNRCSMNGNGGPRGAATQESFQRQQAKIVTGINRLDASIVSLEEVGNSVKFGKDRDYALAGLVDALNDAAGSEVWAYVPSPDASELPPVAEQDVIRVAIIYKPADVTPVGTSYVLSDKSDPGESFSIGREPQAQEFKKTGAPDSQGFLVVANHFKSKGPDHPPLFNDCGPGHGDQENTTPGYEQGGFNCTRVHEAQDLATFSSHIASQVGTDKIFLLGDFNAYTHEDPMETLYDAGYTDLSSAFDSSATENSYNYDALAGSLDHVLANGPALQMVTGADIWEINAQESVAYAYSRYNYNVTTLFDGDTPFAASDHDPVVVGLNLSGAPGWDAGTVYTSGDEVTYDGSTWKALWWTKNQQPGASPWGPWQEIVTAPDGTAVWTPSRIFTSGDVVVYQGTKYEAQWWTRNQQPGSSQWGPWQPLS